MLSIAADLVTDIIGLIVMIGNQLLHYLTGK